MAEGPRRPILSLKSPPAKLPQPPGVKPRAQAAAPPAPPQPGWKCKPCGARLDVPSEAAPDTVVRCPACNARLGRVEQFRADPSPTSGFRARRA
jgi:hypothetical protein